MPLTRGELKTLIKECLVEILSEGLGNVQESMARAPRRPIQGAMREGKTNPGRVNGNGRRKPDFDPRLDSPVNNPVIKEQIRINSGGNPVMAAIFADTAATTLQTLAGDRNLGATSLDGGGPSGASAGGSSPVALQEHIGDPEEVFGEETMGRWADLAFMPPKKPA